MKTLRQIIQENTIESKQNKDFSWSIKFRCDPREIIEYWLEQKRQKSDIDQLVYWQELYNNWLDQLLEELK